MSLLCYVGRDLKTIISNNGICFHEKVLRYNTIFHTLKQVTQNSTNILKHDIPCLVLHFQTPDSISDLLILV